MSWGYLNLLQNLDLQRPPIGISSATIELDVERRASSRVLISWVLVGVLCRCLCALRRQIPRLSAVCWLGLYWQIAHIPRLPRMWTVLYLGLISEEAIS